jgi:hypothetical protein
MRLTFQGDQVNHVLPYSSHGSRTPASAALAGPVHRATEPAEGKERRTSAELGPSSWFVSVYSHGSSHAETTFVSRAGTEAVRVRGVDPRSSPPLILYPPKATGQGTLDERRRDGLSSGQSRRRPASQQRAHSHHDLGTCLAHSKGQHLRCFRWTSRAYRRQPGQSRRQCRPVRLRPPFQIAADLLRNSRRTPCWRQ